MTDEKLLTIQEVADMLKVVTRTIYIWTKKKDFPLKPIRLGSKCIRYRLSDVQKLVDQSRVID